MPSSISLVWMVFVVRVKNSLDPELQGSSEASCTVGRASDFFSKIGGPK